ncbi:hypothetical protein V3N99_16865 [Dermatophilaceae bacterium Soc4.6]
MPLHDRSFDPRQVFTRIEGLKAGLTPYELRTRQYVRVFRGVYVARSVPCTTVVRARAALRIAPDDAVVSHHTAAIIWGGDVVTSSSVHLTVEPRQVVVVPGIRARQRARRPEVTMRQGVRVTTAAQTFLDLAGDLDLVELVVLGDRFVARRVTTCQELVEAAASWPGWARERAIRAASLVRAGVDSPPESRLRMLLVLAGLPEPTVNHRLRHPDGHVRRRMELAYEELLIGIEYHGRQHRTKDAVWVGDISRREELTRESWRFVEVIQEGLVVDPVDTVMRVERARVERGARPTGPLREEFRRYFPGQDGAA